MPNLKQTLDTISGVDIGGNEFSLQETDVQQYIDNPETAQMEADITKARYGGSSIQDPSPSDPSQASSVPGPGGGQPRNIDFSRRGDFEGHVFNQLKSENMPDGNPFNFDPNAQLNTISKQDLPELFERVFSGEVSWQDRHLLDDDQKKFWMSKVKQYRAHVDTGLKSERQAAVNQYNQMMNSFDNAAKEQTAKNKQQRENRKQVYEAKIKAQERGNKREQDYKTNLADHADALTEERELIAEYLDAETAGTLTPKRSVARLAELEAIRKRRKHLAALIKSREVPKPKSGITKVKVNPKKAPEVEPEKDADGKTIVRKKMPEQGGKTAVAKKPTGKQIGETFDKEIQKKKDPDDIRIVKTRVIKDGKNKGRTVNKYSDGSTAYADEIK